MLAAITSAVAWSGHVATIPFALFAPLLLHKTRSRLQAYAALFSYYVGASWPLIPGSQAFFGDRATAIQGISMCLCAAALLALPAALFFTRSRTKVPFAIAGVFLFTAIPPLGIIGWGSPLLSAGVLFPGTAWAGLVGTLALVSLLGRFPIRMAATAAVFAVLANALYKQPSIPTGWKAINTEFGGAGQGDPDFLSEFYAAEEIQMTITHSDAQVLVFPEHVVTQWTEATETFWRGSLNDLAERHATILLGVGLPRPGGQHMKASGRYYKALIARTQQTQAVYYQRIPVPLAMWKPLSADGVPLNLFGPGTIPVQNQRAAVLICYEQLLVWPFLSSALEHPTILVATANDYWAKRTSIPMIQKVSALSWARLFRLPIISAVNQ